MLIFFMSASLLYKSLSNMNFLIRVLISFRLILLWSIIGGHSNLQLEICLDNSSPWVYGMRVSNLPCIMRVGQDTFLAQSRDWNLSLTTHDRQLPKRCLATSLMDVNGLIMTRALGFRNAATCTATPVPIDRPMIMISLSSILKYSFTQSYAFIALCTIWFSVGLNFWYSP